jgi:dTDP-4-dehydrorhamnose 3,5-epimerase
LKILEVKDLAIPEIKVIRFSRFHDHRGYFTEHFRRSDLERHPQTSFMQNIEFCQCNESYSRAGTVRGLHLQWNPYMGKMVRTVVGHMVDLVLDIRRCSPSIGKILAYDMPVDPAADAGEWIWVPPGFAHGNFFLKETQIEYFCSGEYSPNCEAGISPLCDEIDWSLCDPKLRKDFADLISGNRFSISDKDRNGHSLSSWFGNPDSEKFVYFGDPAR